MARTCTVSVALTAPERAKVLAEAKAHGQSPSAWIHDLLALVLAP
jgi:phage terminase large subunit-like protein